MAGGQETSVHIISMSVRLMHGGCVQWWVFRARGCKETLGSLAVLLTAGKACCRNAC